MPRSWLPPCSRSACATPVAAPSAPLAPPSSAATQPGRDLALPAETHLANLRQLTFGGENAEAYWSWAGDALILQARPPEAGCDRIFRLPLTADGRAAASAHGPRVQRPGRDDLLVLPARRQAGDLRVDAPGRGGVPAAARPQHGLRLGALRRLRHLSRQRRRQRRAPADHHARLRRRGHGVRQGRLDRLHVGARRRHRALPHGRRRQERAPADARASATTAARSSTPTARRSSGAPRARSRARSSTTTSACSRRTWCGRPSSSSTSPTPTAATRARSRTWTRRRSAPRSRPAGKRIIFSSNYGDPHGREFDLWAIDVDGTRLERITAAPGFDGFPLFSPDGKRLAFASNRATAPGAHDTNVFVADWKPEPVAPARDGRAAARRRSPADRIAPTSAGWPTRSAQGRGIGTPGLEASGAYIEQRFKALGLEPAGDGGGFRQPFAVRTGMKVEPATALKLGGTALARDAFQPSGFSAPGKASGAAGAGRLRPASTRTSGIDDYAGSTCAARSSSCAASCPSTRRWRRPSGSGAPATCGRRRGWRASAARARC